jgi:phage terminase small subunit
MPVLPNNKHELFAQGLAKGLSADAAYQPAGYKQSRSAASRLSTNVNIRARVEELQNKAAEKVELSKAWVLARLKQTVERAMQAVFMGPFPTRHWS